jgi:hypothetical protein
VLIVLTVIIAVVVVAGVGFAAWAQVRRRGLRERFGPEYDRTVERHKNTREAERELVAREQRHADLKIRPLSPEAGGRYREQWASVQEQFVDAPAQAVTEADRLVIVVMGERGYPTEGYEQQVDDLSVEHGATVERYRAAHDISGRAETNEASTEDLRQAMVHYRTLFDELLDDGETHPAEEAAADQDADAHEAASTAGDEDLDQDPAAEPVVGEEPVSAEEPVEEPEAAPVEATTAGKSRRAGGRSAKVTETEQPNEEPSNE